MKVFLLGDCLLLQALFAECCGCADGEVSAPTLWLPIPEAAPLFEDTPTHFTPTYYTPGGRIRHYFIDLLQDVLGVCYVCVCMCVCALGYLVFITFQTLLMNKHTRMHFVRDFGQKMNGSKLTTKWETLYRLHPFEHFQLDTPVAWGKVTAVFIMAGWLLFFASRQV